MEHFACHFRFRRDEARCFDLKLDRMSVRRTLKNQKNPVKCLFLEQKLTRLMNSLTGLMRALVFKCNTRKCKAPEVRSNPSLVDPRVNECSKKYEMRPDIPLPPPIVSNHIARSCANDAIRNPYGSEKEHHFCVNLGSCGCCCCSFCLDCCIM